MSIFPKKIASGENVIIHLRFENSKMNNKLVKYFLNVYNPKNKIIYSKSDNIIIGYGSNYSNEIYHSIMIKKNYIPGKYIVEFYMDVNGKRIDSITKNNDFFYVEKIKFYKKNNSIILKNLSNENTKCTLYDEHKKEIILSSNEVLNYYGNYQYIEYGNNQIFKLDNNIDFRKKE